MTTDNITIDNIIKIATFVFTMIGGVAAFLKWRNDKGVDRASRLENLRSQFYAFKPDAILKKMEMDQEGMERHSKGDSDTETNEEVTRKSFFAFLAHLCYLMDMKVISEKEFAFFKWQIVGILEKQCVIDMIASFYCRSLPRRDEDKPFYSLVKFAIRCCTKEKSENYEKLQSGQLKGVVPDERAKVMHNCEQNNILASVDDSHVYNTHLDVLNGIFNFDYLGHMKGSATLPDGDLVWFPLIIEDSKVPPARERHQWYNVLSHDGLEIREYMPISSEISEWSDDELKRYTFGKVKVNKRLVYRFYGVFSPYRIDAENRFRVYKRVGTVIDGRKHIGNA